MVPFNVIPTLQMRKPQRSLVICRKLVCSRDDTLNHEIVSPLFPLFVLLTLNDSMSGLEGTTCMIWFTDMQTCVHGTLFPNAIFRSPNL